MALCACGCGQQTALSYRKGGLLVPNRFVQYHCQRTPDFKRGQWEDGHIGPYFALHRWVRQNKVKTGQCRGCGRKIRTEWANISGLYFRDLDDFAELCKACHMELDSWSKDLL